MSTIFSVKALNQYRKRDIFPYLALRYYVDSSVGRQDRWINDVCTRLTIQNDNPGYLRMYHFKDISNDIFIHRDIYIPTPSEALAEVALITELSSYEAFAPKPYVYSYRFSSRKEKNGVFKQYFDGFKERHKSISDACWKVEVGVVLYTDIKKFYPSINSVDAVATWVKTCELSDISVNSKLLGLKILENHRKVCLKDDTGNGLLTGPMFSHVIANLLLNDIDMEMFKISGGNYWRYVDDVVFVGTSKQVTDWREKLEEKFDELNLVLHEGDKDFQVPCNEWLEGDSDFDKNTGDGWVSLISDVKRFLLANPSQRDELEHQFQDNNIRIPVVDYSNAVKESTYLQNFQDWMGKYKWAINSVKSISIDSLIKNAKKCESKTYLQLENLLEEDSRVLTSYAEKRRTPKLRYLSGRLLYLSNIDLLGKLSKKLNKIPELYLIAKTMEAVSTKNFTDVLLMGVNATHAAAQLVRSEKQNIVEVNTDLNVCHVVEQSLAVLEMNGIKHNYDAKKTELMMLASADNINELMSSENQFIREFACLHGINEARHQTVLDSSFDRDEDLAMDVLSQLQRSSHC